MSRVHLKAKVGFASVLSAVVFVATGHGVALPRADAAVERICAVGGKEEFRTFLRMAAGEGAKLECFGEVESLPLATASNTLFVVAPRYARGEVVCRRLGDRMVAEMEAALRRGNRFYFENVPSESMAERRFLGVTMLGAKPAPFERRILETDVGLLQFRAGGYMPGALYTSGPVKMRAKVVASVSDALGVNAVFLPAQERGPAVAASADGRRIFSFVRLSACDARTVRPYARWRAFYARSFAALLGRDEAYVSAAFVKAWPALLADSGMRAPDEVVKKAIAWHENSGVLFSPDGAKGMREAVSSDGFGWRGALRVDCNMMTGALFAWAGRIYGRPDWTRIGRNLADHILARGCQTEEGYFRWFDKDADGGASVFATDHGRSTLAAINLYCATRDERYLAVARRAADAFMAWQADDGLVTIWFDLRRGPAPKKGHSENPVCYYENISALFRMAELTGDGKYAAAALKCVETMSAKFPDFNLGTTAFYSANSIYGRYLLMAASAQRATDADFSRTINGVLDFYERNQHPRGGIAETKIRLVAHEEAGVGIGDGSDHIADLLYCNNFSFAALSILAKLPPEKAKGVDIAKARRIYAKLRDFLASVQISSSDAKFDGAWMRAYDMDIGEWHGLDKDAGWGPYCIETGWTMGTIPAVFLFDDRDGSYF